MAENKQAAPALFIVALLLFSAATPTAYGQLGLGVGNLLPGVGGTVGNVQPNLIVSGALCCSPTGNCNNTTPALPGVPTGLICNTGVPNATVNLGTVVTGLNGTINITVAIGDLLSTVRIPLATLLSGGKLPCAVFGNLRPLINQTVCPLLNAANNTVVGALGNVIPILSSTRTLVGINVSVLSFAVLGITVG